MEPPKGHNVFPWNLWLDGKPYTIKYDSHSDVLQFKSFLAMKARKWKKWLRLNDVDDVTVTFQFFSTKEERGGTEPWD